MLISSGFKRNDANNRLCLWIVIIDMEKQVELRTLRIRSKTHLRYAYCKFDSRDFNFFRRQSLNTLVLSKQRQLVSSP